MYSNPSVKYTRLQDHDVSMNEDSIDIETEVSNSDYSSSSKRSVYYTSAAILGIAAIGGVALYLSLTAVQNVSEGILTNAPNDILTNEHDGYEGYDLERTICEVTKNMGSCLYNVTTNVITSALQGYQQACDKIQTCLSEQQLYGVSEGLQHTVRNICNDVAIKICDKVNGTQHTIGPGSYNTDAMKDIPNSFYACGTDSCFHVPGSSDKFPT